MSCFFYIEALKIHQSFPEFEILVLTYIELENVFNHFKTPKDTNPYDHFDLSSPGMTRLYPLDGGLSHSSGLTESVEKGEVKVVSGVQNNIAAIKEFEENTKIRLLDILNCDGGCIGGPGIKSDLSVEDRKKRIFDYMEKN